MAIPFRRETSTSTHRVPWLAALLAPALFAAPVPAPGPAPGQEGGEGEAVRRRPNVVFIFTDDQDWNQFSMFGDEALTPHIDKLARDGAFFSRFYVSAAVCTPSRYNVLTGRYASRSAAVLEEFPPPGQSCLTWNANLRPGEKTIAHCLREAGYVTGVVGKWMCGSPPDLIEVDIRASHEDPEVLDALRQNYDRACSWIREHFGFEHTGSIYRTNLAGLGLPRSLQEHNMEWITKGALEFIEANAERPFFLYMATTLPHTPRDSIYEDPRIVPTGMLAEPLHVQPTREDVLERVEKAGLSPEAAEYTWLDDAVGAVLAKLDELDLAENTMVIYAPDHATRGKYTCYEGANVPLFIRWPGHIEPGTRRDELVSNIDLLPTILEVTGAELLEGMEVDGRSFVPLLGPDPPADLEWRDSLLLEIAYTKAVVTDRWKYLALRYPPEVQERVDAGEREKFAQDGGTRLRRTNRYFPGYYDYDQLYDLEEDPLEQTNLAGEPEHADRTAALKELLGSHLSTFPGAFGEFHVPDRDGQADVQDERGD